MHKSNSPEPTDGSGNFGKCKSTETVDSLKKTTLPELLAPAGNFEKLKAAINYGANAVYLAGNRYGMRAAAGNFQIKDIKKAVEYAHDRGVKVYITVNIMPHTSEYAEISVYLKQLEEAGADALIISDLGVFMLAKEVAPSMPIHISTQASVVSAATCNAWHKLGAQRIILARELSLAEIREIRENIPHELELEAFVHGSMCVSYSGRCLLSNYLTGRDANRGACTQPCRWQYKISHSTVSADERPPVSMQFDITEVKRPSEPLTLIEEGSDTYIYGSRDLCMIEHIPALVQSGLSCLKIEGRMKSSCYTATVTNAYRMALDAYASDSSSYVFNPDWMRELESVCHRQYCTGFFFGDPLDNANICTENGYIKEQAALAIAVSASDGDGFAEFIQKNKFSAGDEIQLLSPGEVGKTFTANAIIDTEGNQIQSTPHPYMKFSLKVPFEVKEGFFLRASNV